MQGECQLSQLTTLPELVELEDNSRKEGVRQNALVPNSVLHVLNQVPTG
jgi:hypothetical protein